jgi:SpoVK/Ycf46/Vps4 family AAA+-type ATPase
MKKFIDYLDTYSSYDTISKHEYLNLIQQINMNYTLHRVGPVAPIPYKLSYNEWQNMHEPIFSMEEGGEPSFYFPLTPFPMIPAPAGAGACAGSSAGVCAGLPTGYGGTTIPKEPKIKKTIDVDIQDMSDLLKIVREHEYDSAYEYNIDLESLHKIKVELEKMNNMIGLKEFKKSVIDQLLYFIQNLHVGKEGDFKHTVLSGPPGTGKTEVAKLLGIMYSKMGILKNTTFQKVTRSDLIAGYLGQTAIKTQKVIEKSLGGVLFIDEAYALGETGNNDSFSKECIDTICEALSDHKEDLMVIIAGYEDELRETFFKVNRGLESRFIWKFKMEAYSSEELREIFFKKIKENEWDILDSDSVKLGWFEKHKNIFRHYGRDMELLFTYTKIAHGRRVYGKEADLRKKISMEDIERGLQIFIENKGKTDDMEVRESIFRSMFI